MNNDRLPTELWIQANVRRCQSQNMAVYVEKKGDPHTGTVLLKVLNSDYQCRIFSQMRDMDGDMKWFDRLQGETLPESEASVMARDLSAKDPDMWVIEIETVSGENPFDGGFIKL